MANNVDLTTAIETVRNAFYGRDVRQALVDALTATEQAVNDLNQNKIKSGTIEYTLKKAASSVQIPLNLDFVPKQICVSLRDIGTPSPFQNYCTHVQVYKGAYFAVVCMGPSNGATTVNVPAGTYYVDYIAIV
ncbi:hypothetical protein [Ruminococcus sp.]|uniref:hypothetical protein n=1 Tax=Ruminococcus sp. TaxID=41978 RepID=UPI003AF019B7